MLTKQEAQSILDAMRSRKLSYSKTKWTGPTGKA